jgi:hypothetical protein
MSEDLCMPSGWDRIKAALRRERTDAQELVDDLTASGNRALDQRERELAATPDERLRIEQERIAASDEEYEALKRKLDGR